VKVPHLVDSRRPEPPFLNNEREMLESWLEYHRITLVIKCEGLSDNELRRRPVPTSVLSLHGLVRHVTDAERNWFRRCLLRDNAAPSVFVDAEVEGSPFVPLGTADFTSDLASLEAEWTASRAAAAGKTLEHTGLRDGQEVSLRWIYLHMIEEYARHNGHADLIREMIDGAVGC
jgi:uncharacterized damage-inducible protein DinB